MAARAGADVTAARAGLAGAGPPSTCSNATLIDAVLANAPNQKSGYTFAWTPGVTAVAPVPAGCVAGFVDGFAVTATPIVVGQTGQRSFCVDASGVIRFNPAGAVIGTANTLCNPAMLALQ